MLKAPLLIFLNMDFCKSRAAFHPRGFSSLESAAQDYYLCNSTDTCITPLTSGSLSIPEDLDLYKVSTVSQTERHPVQLNTDGFSFLLLLLLSHFLCDFFLIPQTSIFSFPPKMSALIFSYPHHLLFFLLPSVYLKATYQSQSNVLLLRSF